MEMENRYKIYINSYPLLVKTCNYKRLKTSKL